MKKSLNENWDRIDNGIGQDRERIELLEASNTIYNFKGIVQTLTELQEKTKTQGDVWYCKGNSTYYACNGSEWIPVNLNLNLDVIEELEQKTIKALQEVETPTPISGTNIDITDSAEAETTKIKINGNSEQNIIKEVEGTTVTGENITANNIELEDGRIAVSGNSKQETREGYNLLAVDNEHCSYNTSTTTIIYLNDGWVEMKNNTSEVQYVNYTAPTKNIVSGKSYTLKVEFADSNKCNVFLQNANEDYSKVIGNSGNITNTSISDYIKVLIYLNAGLTIKIRLTLVEGTVAKEYEQYGAMPSPDYPSEVESCGDNINLFDGVFEQGYLDGKGNKIDAPSDVLSTMFIPVKPNTSYTFSCAEGYKINRFWSYKSDKTFISRSDSLEVPTITTDSNTYYIRFTVWGQGNSITPNMVSKAKIEKGSTATPYSPYGQGCINEVICNKNLFNLEKWFNNTNRHLCDTATLINNGFSITFKTMNDAYIGYVSGTTGSVLSDEYKKQVIEVKPNTEYTLSVSSAPKCYIEEYDKNYTALGFKQIPSSYNKTNLTFTTTENTKYITVRLGAEGNYTTYQFTDIQLEEGIGTDYVEHQEQVFTISTQQPMRSIGDVRDTFVKINNKWYERHSIDRRIFNGTESFSRMSDSTNIHSRFTFPLQTVKNGSKMYCNMLQQVSQYITLVEGDEAIQLRDISNDNMISIIILNSRLSEATANGFSAYLKSLYDTGTPMYIYYELATPIDIECTEEQIKVLNQLYNTTIYTPTTHVYSTDEISPNTTLRYNYVIASPSVEIPSEVESCGDNVNLIDLDSMTVGYVVNQGAIAPDTSCHNGEKVSDYIKVKPNTSYTFKIHETSQRATDWIGIGEYSSNDVFTFIRRNALSHTDFTEGVEYTITTSETTQYIMVSARNLEGATKIKLEKGSKATGYSPYGQGSINEVICNKNIFNKDDIVEGRFMTDSAIINADWCYAISKSFKAGETYVTSGGRCILAFYNGDINISYKDITNTTITIPEGTTKVYISTLKANLDTLQIEEGTKATEKVERQEQVFTISTQQPMRSIGDVRDTFVKINNKWFERHYGNRVILDGTKKFTIGNPSNRFYLDITLNNLNHLAKSNYFTGGKEGEFGINNTVVLQANRINLMTDKFTTADELNAWILEQYNAGTPVYVDYVLAEPIDIECTEEQSTILFDIEENAKTYNKITHIYSKDEVGPNIEIKYKKDIATLFENTLIESGV